MANFNVSRFGANNGGSDKLELFLKGFSGEVLTAFETANVVKDRVMVRTISSGKSAQFPVLGRATAGYHVPGTEIVGDGILSGEKVITIDALLTASTSIANIDEAMSHYDVRSHYSAELGRVLAEQLG